MPGFVAHGPLPENYVLRASKSYSCFFRAGFVLELKARKPESGAEVEQESTENDTTKENIHEFSEFLDEQFTKKRKLEKNVVNAEIDKYLAAPVSMETPILTFWKNATDLKLLQILARKILATPVSSATSERIFSTSGSILNDRRTRLLSSNLDKILFLYKNM